MPSPIRAAWILGVIASTLAGQTPGTLARSSEAMVASAEPFATEAGLEILKAGGTAVDAAVAVGFALAVTYPVAGNLGGGGFMVIHLPGQGEFTVDYREMAPAAAHRDLYRDQDGKVDPEASRRGHRAAGVPGSVAGLCHVQARFGTLPLGAVLAPAIRLASEGFRVSPALARSLRADRDVLGAYPESKRIFLADGELRKEGDQFLQPELAGVLVRIAEKGRAGFYEGATADLLVAEMKRGKGLITHEDLLAYEVKERAPLRGRYRGFDIVSMPPPSSGGIALIQMLNLLEGFDYQPSERSGPDRAHRIIESMRLAFRDRALHLGDPDFAAVPAKGLTSKAYAAHLRPQIRERAMVSRNLTDADPFAYEKTETTHYSVMDKSGIAVACTTTLNGGHGCGVTVTGAGFLLNNEMDDFAIAPGVPNMFDLIQGEANAVGPKKRPLSSMTPTLVMKDGKVMLVIGSPGGPTIINTVLHVVLNVLDDGMEIDAAIAAPRFHHQWLPDRTQCEPKSLTESAESVLGKRGHRLEARTYGIGDAQGIRRDLKSGILFGAADPRRSGLAKGL